MATELPEETDEIWVDANNYCYRSFNCRHQSVFGWEKQHFVFIAALGLPKSSGALPLLLEIFEDE